MPGIMINRLGIELKIEYELQHRFISNHLLALVPNYYYGGYECDLFSLNKNLFTIEYEIKRSKADFNIDFKKNKTKYSWTLDQTTIVNTKHELIESGKRTNRFYFVIKTDLEVEIPKYAGLIMFSERNGWINFEIVRKAPRLHKRKADVKIITHCLGKLNWRYYSMIRKNGRVD